MKLVRAVCLVGLIYSVVNFALGDHDWTSWISLITLAVGTVASSVILHREGRSRA